MLLLSGNIFTLFVEAGAGFMTIITLMLIAMFFAAWKAPAWIKEIGLLALAFGFLATFIGFIQAADFIRSQGDLSQNVIWGGVKVGLIPTAYGIIVYIVSLVLRIIKKPHRLPRPPHHQEAADLRAAPLRETFLD